MTEKDPKPKEKSSKKRRLNSIEFFPWSLFKAPSSPPLSLPQFPRYFTYNVEQTCYYNQLAGAALLDPGNTEFMFDEPLTPRFFSSEDQDQDEDDDNYLSDETVRDFRPNASGLLQAVNSANESSENIIFSDLDSTFEDLSLDFSTVSDTDETNEGTDKVFTKQISEKRHRF